MPSSRRKFVGQCCAAVGVTGMASTLASLRATVAAADIPSGGTPPKAGAVASDYKALVCIFLSGGNDASNVIIPNDSGYSGYASARSVLALPQSVLLPLTPRNSDGRAWGLHPSLAEVHGLFNAGRLALLTNVGTLVEPTTKAQYNARTVKLPPQLFSHNDQQVQWQSSVPDQPFRTGWGGRMADLVNSLNSNSQASMSVTLNGFNNLQVGSEVVQLAVQPASANSPKGGSVVFTNTAGANNSVRYAAQKDLFGGANANLFASAFGSLSSDAIGTSELLGSVLSSAPTLATTFPNTSLANQLKSIAYLISIAGGMNLKRQVFFARIGGWDTHADQVDANTAVGAHANLLQQVSQAMNAFYDATVELGCADRVTTFTASDFGRTYSSNGDGTDHGWGAHHLVMGGAVNGGDIYGRMPTLTIGGPDDTAQGRWIPTTSVDEYGATLARWFGVSATNLSVAFPNIGRFANPNLGFV
jgi:uncharacterized protein (DUF1501 family)